MKTLCLHILLYLSNAIAAQSLNGHWLGIISRDFGEGLQTDSIEFHLIQHGSKVSGISILSGRRGSIIKSWVEGRLLPGSQTIRLSETGVQFTNIPGGSAGIFQDLYLLNYNPEHPDTLDGKTIARHRKALYTGSVIRIKKQP